MPGSRTRISVQPDHALVTYPWALLCLVCAVYLPLFRSRIILFGGDIALFESWLGPAGARATNVLLHGLTTVVAYQLGRRLMGSTTVAFWAAVLFAVHPVHVDAVARVAGSTELIAALILLALVLLFSNVRQLPGKYSAVWLLSASVMWLGFRYLQRGQPGPANPLLEERAWIRFLTGVNVLGRCFTLLVWPYRLSPDYSYNSVPAVANLWSPAFLVPFVCIAAVLVLAVLHMRYERAYLLCCVFLLICAFPLWGLGIPVLAETFLYFPSVAFCWMLALFFSDAGLLPHIDWRDVRFLKYAALLVIFLVLPWSAKTYIRSGQWCEEKALLQHAAGVVPGNAYVQLLLGDYYERQGDHLAAQRFYRKALEIKPDYAEAALKLDAAYRSWRTGTGPGESAPRH